MARIKNNLEDNITRALINTLSLTNAIGTFQANGVIQNSLWNWNVNDTIFLNGNSLSNIRPTTGILQRIGTAKTTDTIILKLSDPIRL